MAMGRGGTGVVKSASRRSMVMVMVMVMVAMARVVRVRGTREERLRVYLHDNSLFRNASFNTATVAVERSPRMSTPVTQFGKVYVFDDPLTSGPAMRSPRVGSAQGIYVYSGRSNASAFWSYTAFLEGRGALTVLGAEQILAAGPVSFPRLLSVVGGTADFNLARGSVLLHTVASTVPSYFVLSLDFFLLLPS